jgi:hypothetical protein
MLQIKDQYKGVNVEYLLGTVRVTKKIEALTEKDIETAKKWGINLGKYFDEVIENTELSTEQLPTEEPTILPTIAYEGIEVKPKRKKK